GVRPPAGGRDRAREADRGGVPTGAAGSGRARPALARPAAPAADPRRGASLRRWLPPAAARHEVVRLDLRRPRRRRPRAPTGDPAALRLRGALPGRVTGRARGGSGRPREDGALDLRPAAPGRARLAGPRVFTFVSQASSIPHESCVTWKGWA